MRVSTAQWAWGTSAHWQLYYALKGFGRTWFGSFSAGTSHIVNYVSDKKEDGFRIVTRRRHSVPDSEDSAIKVLSQKKRKRASYRLCRRNSSTSSQNSTESDSYITDEEVNIRLWENENTINLQSKFIRSCSTNQLASNQPNEDQIFITKSLHNGGVLFGVLDGHGGSGFSEHAKIRLPYYLHVALLDRRVFSQKDVNIDSLFKDILESDSKIQKKQSKWVEHVRKYLTNSQDEYAMHSNAGHIMSYISNPLRQLFGTSVLGEYAIAEQPSNTEISSAIKEAFLQLDEDIVSEITLATERGMLDSTTLPVAMSGCCALIAYIVDDELFVANLGDCRAVLGSSNGNEWSAVQLTQDHTAVANPAEVKRIISEHPSDERWSCIQYGRLLGRLAPLRALGDIQFKLPLSQQEKIFKGVSKYNPMRSLKTPPYLSAEPEVFNYKIENNDKFLVLASDGLWDMLSNEEVVEVVAAYIEGNKVDMMKDHAHLFGVANCDEILQDPNAFMDTAGENVASFLIRYALGGYDSNNLRAMMSLKYPDVRLYRDDITVAVIFLSDVEDTKLS